MKFYPQIIYIALSLLGVGVVTAKHGQPRGNYSIFTTLFAEAIMVALLYWGGFFDGIIATLR